MTVISSIPQIVPIPSRKIMDLTGQRYGRLYVVGYVGVRKNKTHWLCLCDCGQHTTVESSSLRSGHTQSCGCYSLEVARKKGKANATHGMTHTSEYGTWYTMRNRCENPKATGYRIWGGRGIKVCDRWQKFENFFADMGPRPSPKHSIDRIDNDGDYCPENCRWATWTEQMNNKRTNRYITYQGVTHSLSEWSRVLGIKYTTLKQRIYKRKWSIERAFSSPVSKWR